MRSTVDYTNDGIKITLTAENEADKLLLKLVDREKLNVSRRHDALDITQTIGATNSRDDGWGR